MSAEPPVLPDADQARRWAAEELAKPEYREAEPSGLETLWRGFLDWLGSLDGPSGPDGSVPTPVIGIVIVLVLAVAIVLARPRLNPAARKPKDVFGADSTLTSTDYRQRAAEAAAGGKWGDAVVDRFRALVRSAEDRAVIDPQPGRTADETARELSVPFRAEAHRLAQAAAAFDAVRYGNRPAGSAEYQDMVLLDDALAAAKPEQPLDRHQPAVLP